jgi:hypothetical protein
MTRYTYQSLRRQIQTGRLNIISRLKVNPTCRTSLSNTNITVETEHSFVRLTEFG